MNRPLLLAAISLAAMFLSGCNGVQSTLQSGTSTPSSPPTQPSNPPATPTIASKFFATGNMTTARAGHVAILLPNGKVLIAGGLTVGYPVAQPLADAELYDPSTHTFTVTGGMAIPRSSPGAVLLSNGKVLMVGGSDDLTAEIYDPATGAFTSAGKMVSLGAGGSATPKSSNDSRHLVLLKDGRVLIEGLNAEIYDPTTGDFTPTAAYTDLNPLWYTSTLLNDGRVLLTGCRMNIPGNLACGSGATEIYDPGTNTFSSASPLSPWDDVYTATLLTNGKVLIAGSDEMDGPADALLFDPTATVYIPSGTTAGTHEFSAAVRLTDGTVLITGGQMWGGSGNAEADLYDPSTAEFTSLGIMNHGRHNHTATLLQDGTVLIAGGWTGWPASTNTAELYKP
jgi:hypothetical protein